MISKIVRLSGLARELSMVQDNIADSVDDLVSVVTMDGRFIEGQKLFAGVDNVVIHRLGRPLRGWFVADLDVDARIWSVLKDKYFLRLRTNADATISLWVF